jgi:hypothetical protein
VKACLPCPHCHAALAPSELLVAAEAFLPEHELLELDCPRCGRDLWAQARPGHVAVGPRVAAPDDFRPSASAPAPGLTVNVEGGALECRYLGGVRRFPARAPGQPGPPA